MPERQRKQRNQKITDAHVVLAAGGNINYTEAGSGGGNKPPRKGGPDSSPPDNGEAGDFTVPAMLPRDPPQFTGREDELAQLTALPDGGKMMVAVISGAGGMGKTALALRAAHQLRDKFTGGQLYRDLHEYLEQPPDTPGEVFSCFLQELGVPAGEIPVDVAERKAKFRRLLATRRVLMVLDNAVSEAQVEPLLPGAGEALVLVASRSSLDGLSADKRIRLGTLPEDKARTLLTTLIDRPPVAGQPDPVQRALELCDGWPLALRIVGQRLRTDPAWLDHEFLDKTDGKSRLGSLNAGDLDAQATLEACYRQLGDDDARMFRLLGLHFCPSLDERSVAKLVGVDDAQATAMLGRLTTAYLVTAETTKNSQRQYGMHGLLRVFARDKCLEVDDLLTRSRAEERLIGYYAGLAAELNASIHPHLGNKDEHDQRDKALRTFEAERAGLLAAADLARQRGLDQWVWQLSARTQYALLLRRYFNDLLTLHEAARVATGRAGNYASFTRVLRNLGVAYREMGQLDQAVDYFKRSLSLIQEANDRLGTGQTKNSLGVAHRRLRQFAIAEGLFRQSRDIFQALGDRYGEGQALNNLGNAYLELGKTEDALRAYRESLAIKQEETADHFGVGRTLDNLGSAYARQGQPKPAILHFQKAAEVRQASGDRYGEGRTRANLAYVYLCLRRRGRLAAPQFTGAATAMREAGEHSEADKLDDEASAAYHRWWRRIEPPEGVWALTDEG
jgi:tetratricopeptide (TPR) repeat protein